MNFDDLEFWEQFNIKSIHYLKRYLKLIKLLNLRQDRRLKIYENHHIKTLEKDQNLIIKEKTMLYMERKL